MKKKSSVWLSNLHIRWSGVVIDAVAVRCVKSILRSKVLTETDEKLASQLFDLDVSTYVAVVVSLCSEGRWRCTEADCEAEILCPGELVHRTDISDCNSTCDRLDDCDPEAPLRSGCACPDGLIMHPVVGSCSVLHPPVT